MSELYASILMVGVTVSLGSVLVGAAVGSIGQAQGASSLGASIQSSAYGRELSLVYIVVAPSGTCPPYRGVREGTELTLAMFDYGANGFSPAEFVVNSTVLLGTYPGLSPGTMGQYTITLGSCAHSGGQTVTAIDSEGDVVQVGS